MLIKIPSSVSTSKDPDTPATSAPGTLAASMLSTPPLPGKPSVPDTILLIAIGTLVGGIALCILCVILGSIWFHLKDIKEQKHAREKQMANITRIRVPIMDYDHHPDYLLTRKLNLSALSRSVSATSRRSMRYPRPSSSVQPLPTLLEGDSPHSLHLTPPCNSSQSLPLPTTSGSFGSFSSEAQQPSPSRLDTFSRIIKSPLLASDSGTCVESDSSLPGFFKIEFSEPLCSEITALSTNPDITTVKNMVFSSASNSSGDD